MSSGQPIKLIATCPRDKLSTRPTQPSAPTAPARSSPPLISTFRALASVSNLPFNAYEDSRLCFCSIGGLWPARCLLPQPRGLIPAASGTPRQGEKEASPAGSSDHASTEKSG